MSKHRNYTLYIDQEDRHLVLENLKKKVQWFSGQDEVGTHGMGHVHLMFGFKNPRTHASVMKLLQNKNIHVVNDSEKCMKNCMDETKRDPNGDVYVHGDIPNFNRKVNKELIHEALDTGTYDDAMSLIESEDILYYIQNQKKLGFYLAKKFDSSDKCLYSPSNFNIPLFQNFDKVLVFIGITGIGKTQFALAHFRNPLHIRDKEDWRRYSESTEGIILDDLDFPSWCPLTFLKLLDIENPITQNVKYGSVRIRAGTPRIICVNHEELLWPKHIHNETKLACERRIEKHHFHNKLYPNLLPIS